MSEKKTGRGAIFLIVLVMAAVIVMAAVMGSRMTPEEAGALIESWKAFAVERVIPIAVAIVCGLAFVVAALWPVIRLLRERAEAFVDGVKSMQAAEGEAKSSAAEMRGYREELQRQFTTECSAMREYYEGELDKLRLRVDAACQKIEGVGDAASEAAAGVRRLLDVAKIEAAADPALVESGKARRIVMIADGKAEPDSRKDGEADEC